METTDVYEHSLSAETIANNVDILTAILLRVPAKSLVRFKCTSKHWLSLISDSKFCNEHTRKNLNPPVSGLYIDSRPLINFNTKTRNGQQSLPKLEFLTNSLHGEVKILHSCNGLMLCSRGPEVIVCNPTVQKFKVVPSDKDRSWSSLFLSFSPSKSPYFEVVSIDITLSTHELIGNHGPVIVYGISIYSSESGMWETIDVCAPEFEPFTRYVLCDGALYWMALGNNVVRFDIDTKSMTTHQVSLEPVIFSDSVLYFGGYEQYLTLVQSSSPTRTVFEILEMDTRNFRWIIKYDLDLGPVIDTSFVKCFSESVYVLYFKGRDEEETPTLLIATTQEIIIYNPKSKCRENILEDLPRDIETKMGKQPLYADKFIGSLALF